MKSIIERYKSFPPLLKFLTNGVILVLVWFTFYQFLRNSTFIHNIYEVGTEKLTENLLIISKFVLDLFGFETFLNGKIIRIEGTGGVYLDRGCLGRNLMGLYVGFILAYPGKIKHKLWVVPAGLLVIIILNIMRISGLTYLVLRWPEYVDINHHVIFKYTVYFFIFLMWYFWIKHYSVSAKPRKKNTKSTELVS